MPRTTLTVTLTPAERRHLEHLVRQTTISQGLHRRARMVLMRADGAEITHICTAVGVTWTPVAYWLKQWQQHGLAGITPGQTHARTRSDE